MDNYTSKLEYRRFHRDNAFYWNNLANQRQFEFAKQLLTLSALILTVSSSVMAASINTISFQEQPLQSFSILLSWVFGLVSIICGFKQLNDDSSYFNYLSNDESLRESKFRQMNYIEDAIRLEEDSIPPTKPRGPEKWLARQKTFFGLGVTFLLVFATLILMSPS